MDYDIEKRLMDEDKPVFIIAEMSANHNQDFNIAIKTIKAIKETGADAVKLQTFTPDTITIDCNNDYFKIKGTLWDGRTLYDLYKEAYTPWEWHKDLKKVAEDLGLVFFSTPFDKTSVDFLEELNVPMYKIASFEITDQPLIEYVASKNKPIIISTGIALFEEIEEAVNSCKKVGNDKIALLKCTSSYPAMHKDMNLSVIPNLKQKFNTVIGLSDHSMDMIAPIAAVSLGAKIIEKHFILDRNLGGPDKEFSLEPNEFREMVKLIRETEKALGHVTYELTDTVKKNRVFSRSLFVVKDIKKGKAITKENTRSIRPGYGIKPKHLNEILGKKVKCDISKGTPLSFENIDL